jgi:hypothetical protein
VPLGFGCHFRAGKNPERPLCCIFLGEGAPKGRERVNFRPKTYSFPSPHEKIVDLLRLNIFIMDIEHINAIGNQLVDLAERTSALRGYL